MKKAFVFIGVLAVATVALTGANAASTSGVVQLKGTVKASCEISVNDLGATLDLEDGERNKKIASIEESCNNYDGYTVSFTSKNSGSLRSADGAKIDYTVNYDTKKRTGLNKKLDLRRSNARFNEKHDLFVNVNASNTRTAGAYADTITVTIRAN